MRKQVEESPPTHWPVRQLYRLGDVTLAKLSPNARRPEQLLYLHFPLQVGGKLRVLRRSTSACEARGCSTSTRTPFHGEGYRKASHADPSET